MQASPFAIVAGLYQETGGISSWVWILILLVLIVLVLWWLGRQDRGPIETTGQRKAEEESKATGLPTVEEVANPAQGASVFGGPEIEQAPVLVQTERGPQVIAPEAIVPDVMTPGTEVYSTDDARDNVDVPVLRHETGPGIEPVLGVENPVEEAQATMTPLKPDDLEIIEGIGPKIASLLRAAEIGTFSKLAQTPVSRLQELMHDANLRIADPTTWPEQARLAAEGRWDELKEYQATLRGGRVV